MTGLRVLRRTAFAVGALTCLSAVLVGVPLGLARSVGWPLPHALPASWTEAQAWLTRPPADPRLLTARLAACACWWAWAEFAACAAVEAAAAVRGRIPARVALAGPLQAAAAGLIAALTLPLLLRPAAASTPSHAAAAAPATPPDHVGTTGQAVPAAVHPRRPAAADRPHASPMPRVAPPLAAAPGPARHVQPTPYTVAPGDCAWTIAATHLGEPRRWTELWALNHGQPQPDGRTWTDPDLIRPGWRLLLPPPADPETRSRPDRPRPPAIPHRPTPRTGAPAGAPAIPSTSRPPASRPPTSGPSRSAPAAPMPPPGAPTVSPHPRPPTRPAGPPRPTTATPPPPATAQPPAPGTTPGSPPAGDDDGVITTGPPTPAPSVPGAGPARGPTPPAAPAVRPAPPGVALPGGSWLDLSLATAVAAAAGLVWAHRRRRYRPAPEPREPLAQAPDPGPLPVTVMLLRRALRRATSYRATLDRPDSPPTGETAEQAQPPDPTPAAPPDRPWPAAGLGLTGPAATAAARGMLVAALASGADDPHTRASFVISAPTLQALLGADTPASPRLTVTRGLPDALQLLEEQALHRTRVLFDHEVDHAAALPVADPTAEPLPPLVLLADIDAAAGHEHARIAALVAHGERLNLHGVLLGPWPPGQTVTVAPDGTTTPADTDSARHAAHTDTERLTVLTAAEATDLAVTLIEAHGDTNPPPRNPAPNAEKTPSPDSAATSPPPTAAQQALPDDDSGPADTQAVVAASNGIARTDANGDAATSRARITVLGRPGVDDSTAEPGDPLRPKSLELLVYLAVHGGSARVETILEDLLPDAPARKAPYRLHTYVYSLRKTLHRCAGPGTYLEHPAGRYALNPAAVDIDLWTMRAALTEADTATTPAASIAALRRAVAAYTAPLADGCDYEWIEPHREAIRRQALDAHLTLADALTDTPADALAVLTTAIGHDPYAETAYQHAMRAHAALGQPDAIRDLRRTLTRRLEEIDAEPADDTLTLANQLTTDPRQSQPSQRDSDRRARAGGR